MILMLDTTLGMLMLDVGATLRIQMPVPITSPFCPRHYLYIPLLALVSVVT